jgi:multiple sugar transport system ATP-binding protein
MPARGFPAEGAPIVYGIRPEHFQLAGDGVPAKVSLIEPTGSETQVMAQFAGAPIIAAFRERVSARPGETIHIVADPAMVHLFDASTGQRLGAA